MSLGRSATCVMPKAVTTARRAAAKRRTAAPSMKSAAHQFLRAVATPPTTADTEVAAHGAAAQVAVEEDHPLGPYVHDETRVLLCGTFPPVRKSINFFYPNANNDMWRILGVVFYNNSAAFYKLVDAPTQQPPRRSTGAVLDEAHIRNFTASAPIGFCDCCRRVRRQLGNSSDDNIVVLDRADVVSDALARAPRCAAIITTGTLALTMLIDNLATHGSFCDDKKAPLAAFRLDRRGRRKYNLPPFGGRLMWIPEACCPFPQALWIYRAPSTSRALPLPLAVKTNHYRRAFANHIDALAPHLSPLSAPQPP